MATLTATTINGTSDYSRLGWLAATVDCWGRPSSISALSFRWVDLSLVERVAPGDLLLVHGGVALERLEEPSDG